jgi:hypothetical protein
MTMSARCRCFTFALFTALCGLVPGGSIAQDSAETRLDGFVFTTPVPCGDGADGCSMVSFQIHGEAALLIFDGMTSEGSAEPDLCTGWHYKADTESGLICYVADDRSDGLCTFGYDFTTKSLREWAGSC